MKPLFFSDFFVQKHSFQTRQSLKGPYLFVLVGIHVFFHPLFAQDSLHIEGLTSARIVQRTADVSKANEEGMVLLTHTHTWNEAWKSVVQLKTQRLLQTGIVECLALQWQKSNRQTWLIGAQTLRSGEVLWWDQHTLFSRHWNSGKSFDVWGTGVHVETNLNAHNQLDLTLLINARESGSVITEWKAQWQHFLWMKISTGILLYDTEENDNLWNLSAEGFLRKSWFQLHGTLTQSRWWGNNQESNATNTPGWQQEAFLEFIMNPISHLRLIFFTWDRRYHKRYDHKEQQWAGEFLWIFHPWFQGGIRSEHFRTDSELSWYPRLIWQADIHSDAGIRVSAGMRNMEDSQRSKELEGNLWFRY